MIETVVWGASFGLIALVLLSYAALYRRRERRTRAAVVEAEHLGIAKPAGRFPFVDPRVCIGCGACVAACPEGDVLGLVGGLAVVVNGARCLGIGQCAAACPVGGIELATGSMKGRADVPVTDAESQSTVPGLYVAGELGGLALISNAIEQGSETVRHIARRARAGGPPAGDGARDLLIVGAGPAGLAAALAATEEGLDYEVLEQESGFGGTIFHFPRRKLAHTQPVVLPLYGPLHRSEYSKEALLELFERLVERHSLRIRFDRKVVGLEAVAEGFELRTTAESYRSRQVLLAIGRRGTPRKLGVPGEESPKVMYQLRDADQYRGQRILCVGGGDSAVEAAAGLARRPGNVVTLAHRGKGFHRLKRKNEERLRRLERRGRIRVLLESRVLEIRPANVLLKTREGEAAIENDVVFVMIGGEPPFDLLRSWGVTFGGDVAARPTMDPEGGEPPGPAAAVRRSSPR